MHLTRLYSWGGLPLIAVLLVCSSYLAQAPKPPAPKPASAPVAEKKAAPAAEKNAGFLLAGPQK